MKKILALLLATLLVLSLAACGTDNENPDGDKPSGADTEDPGVETKPSTDDVGEPGNAEETNDADEPDGTTDSNETEGETPEESDPFGPEVLELIASVNEDTAKGKGTCGENLTWYYLDNMLVIRGTGEMENCFDEYGPTPAPWSKAAEQIELVYLEDGVTSIGKYAFSELRKLRAFYMPDSVTSIRDHAFYYCDNLTYIRWSENLAEIESGAFRVTGFESFSFPEGLTKIEWGVFMDAELTSVEIPNSVTEIDMYAFSSCELTSVTIPDSVTTIMDDAFYGNPLTTLTIPASVTYIDAAFRNCPLTTVTFLGDAPEMKEYDDLLMGLEEGVTIQYSGEGFEPYIETYFQYNRVRQ